MKIKNSKVRKKEKFTKKVILGLKTPWKNITNKPGQDHKQQNNYTNQPNRFSRLAITCVIQTTEDMHINNNKKQTLSILMQITQQPSVRNITHKVLDTMKSQIYMSSVVHSQENSCKNLQNQAQPRQNTPIPVSCKVTWSRVTNQVVLNHIQKRLSKQTSSKLTNTIIPHKYKIKLLYLLFYRHVHHFLKIYRVLYKDVVNRCLSTTFQGQSNLSYHCNKQKQTLNQKQINMSLVKPPSKDSHQGTISIQSKPIHRPVFPFQNSCPRRGMSFRPRNDPAISGDASLRVIHFHVSKSIDLKKRNQQKTRDRVRPTLVSQNFCGWNVQKHDYKQKHNLKLSHINKKLQQLKVFQTDQTQQARLMQKNKDQIKYGINRIFRTNHQISTNPRSTSKKHKQKIHF